MVPLLCAGAALSPTRAKLNPSNPHLPIPSTATLLSPFSLVAVIALGTYLVGPWCHIVSGKLMGRVLVFSGYIEQKSLHFISSCNYRSQVDAFDGNRMVTLSEFVFNAGSEGL